MNFAQPQRQQSPLQTAVPAQLLKRLELLQIDRNTETSLAAAFPVVQQELDTIVTKFYAHISSFPDAGSILGSRHQITTLKFKQKQHWSSLFSCKFDQKYVARATRIGTIHFEQGVAPYLYIAGYTFFHCALIEALHARKALAADLPRILASVSRVISLDMDLALSVYTREYWRRTAAGEAPHWDVD
jgi:hypothetical protein